jgi:hypothetical protein
MIRTVILASLLALFAGCVDQQQPTTGTSDQDLLTQNPQPTYTNLEPEWWSSKLISSADYWDHGNSQMVAFIVNGEAAGGGAAGATSEATRMVWLISNSRVYKVYEVYLSDVAQMTQTMRNVFTNVENSMPAQTAQGAPGSAIIVGVDGGVTGGGKKGGGPVHGFPTTVVQSMVNSAASVRSVVISVPFFGAGSLAP